MTSKNIFEEKVVAITGTASGLGRELAVQLAKKGALLALSDIDEDGLSETVNIAKETGQKVQGFIIDVTDQQQVANYAKSVVEDFGHVDMIFNNAGVAVAGLIKNIPYEDLKWIIDINLWGVIHGTKEFLPYLETRPEGHIVNISSVAGLVGVYGLGAYCTTKFAVRGFTETLMQDLVTTNVKATVVHPDFVRTNIIKNGRYHLNKFSKEERVKIAAEEEVTTTTDDFIRQIIQGMEKGKQRIIIGKQAKLIDIFARFLPNHYVKILLRMVRNQRGYDE